MADRPILFSGPMIRALLDGRKTQTRRVAKLPASPSVYLGMNGAGDHVFPSSGSWGGQWRAPYALGDRLWVREAWRADQALDKLKPREMSGRGFIHLDADGEPATRSAWGRRRPGMFMPRWASRLTLTVTDVRVQRVQEVSAVDAEAEGCSEGHTVEPISGIAEGWSARSAFRALWDGLNAPRGYGWDANPWVVALTFDVARRNIDQMGD